MGKRILISLCFFYVVQTTMAQHYELSENKVEIGLMTGLASYNGDIAPDVQVFKSNYGVFFKKQLNNYVGIRLNAEMQKFGSNDLLSSDPYSFARAKKFEINSVEVSAMAEFYFLNYILRSRDHKFSPYLGFGIGYIKNLETFLPTPPPDASKTIPLTFPINFGIKYNILGQFNLFGEATYRFTSIDDLDFVTDSPIPPSTSVYEGGAPGNDQFFSLKLGISYAFNKIYGLGLKIDQQNRKSFFNWFKRK